MRLSRDLNAEKLDVLQSRLTYILNEGTDEDIAVFKTMCGLVDKRYSELTHKKERRGT